MSAGEPTIAWYLVGAASVAILLLPFFATPLSWVVVELLIQQAKASDSEKAIDEEITEIELQSRERRNPPARKNIVDSDSCDRTQSAEHMAEEDLPNSPSAASTVITNEGTNPPAQMSRSNSATARIEADLAGANERRPSDVLTKEGQFLEIELYEEQSDRIDHSKFQRLNIPACAMMYAGLMCLCLSFMCCELPLHALYEWYGHSGMCSIKGCMRKYLNSM